jgi:hypothetical protein
MWHDGIDDRRAATRRGDGCDTDRVVGQLLG